VGGRLEVIGVGPEVDDLGSIYSVIEGFLVGGVQFLRATPDA
jgi:hypothetical protein